MDKIQRKYISRKSHFIERTIEKGVFINKVDYSLCPKTTS